MFWDALVVVRIHKPSYSLFQSDGQLLLAGYINTADRGVRHRAHGTFCSFTDRENNPLFPDSYSAPYR